MILRAYCELLRRSLVSKAPRVIFLSGKSLFDSKLNDKSLYRRFVQEVSPDHLWVAVSACERGMLSAVESSDDPQEIADLETRFREGEPLTCTVCEVS